MVADDSQSDQDIADTLRIGKRTLERWKLLPAFKARVAEIVAAYREAVMSEGIADKANRVADLNDRWKRMRQVIVKRAADPKLASVPGGDTGLLVHQVKGIGKGPDFMLVDMYAVDTALLAEMRNTETAAARELGQLIERHDITTRDTGIAESLDSKLAGLAERLRAGGVPAESDSG